MEVCPDRDSALTTYRLSAHRALGSPSASQALAPARNDWVPKMGTSIALAENWPWPVTVGSVHANLTLVAMIQQMMMTTAYQTSGMAESTLQPKWLGGIPV